MSATELAEAIRSRQVSSREVIEAHLRRIEAVDPEVNAVPVVLGEQALQAADAADRTVAPAAICRGCTASRSWSSPTSTSRERPPPRASGRSRTPTRRGTPRSWSG